VTALDAFAEELRWVAWRNEARRGKLTKVPYAPGGRKAKPNDLSTWGPRKAAEGRAAKIVKAQGGGIGIVLGDLSNDLHLAGIDLDSCLDVNGTPAAWATAILDVVQSYAELSPSGCGLKIFFYVESREVRPFLDSIAAAHDHWGVRRGVPGENARDHGPAIEVYFRNRYFAVTGKIWPSAPDELRLLDSKTFERLTALIPRGNPTGSRRRSGADNSRSAIAFRKGLALRRAGKTFDEMCVTLRSDPETADWVQEKGDLYGGRELRRIWDRADRKPSPSPEFSDDALALEFTERHAQELLYVAKWGSWLNWDGTRWKFEDTLKAFDFARSVAREQAKKCSERKQKAKVASAATVAAIERLARSDRLHAATVDDWDSNPWLLNTPNSVVDLRSGSLLRHDRTHYITKITAVGPSGDCPLWRKFLDEITGGDMELQSFLQRIAGYLLTGSIREHALFFFYGTGGNGKGVFINTLTAILADYAAVAPMETFIVSQGERHPTDLAGLRGARLVTAQETERGRRWAESKIKTLTGGDPITARFMRQDFFTYFPAFKLVIAGNHKPSLGGVDAAIRRRFHLVPFTVTIAKPDKNLPDKLRAEWPGILAWMIDGCVAWQRDGLNPPAVVCEATKAYLGEEDTIAQWMDECCVTGKEQWGIGCRLWQCWKTWAEANNELPGTRKAFAEAMAAHGLPRDKRQGVRGYAGIDLKPAEQTRAEVA
jgi:P4 family phage/plasmid primase-like protien